MTKVDAIATGAARDAVSKEAAAALETGSRSFDVAARLLDPERRESARLLYAWCRRMDDLVDDQTLGHGLGERAGPAPAVSIAALRARTLDALGAGRPADSSFEALRRVSRRHAIPAREPLALLDGFAMDLEGRAYETIDDTLDYCWHVAGVVGVMMGRVLGVEDDATLDRACDLGLAFQLTNIARDVLEDHAAGRLYLPRRWLADEGLDAETAADPARRERLHAVVVRLLDHAEPYYASAAVGVAALPRRSAWAIEASRRIYRAIGARVRRRGPKALAARTVVGAPAKVGHAMAATGAALAAPFTTAARPRPPELWSRPC